MVTGAVDLWLTTRVKPPIGPRRGLVGCLDNSLPFYTRLTQLGECFSYKEEVIGSNPISSIGGDPPPHRARAAVLRKTFI